MILKEFKKEELYVKIYDTRENMGTGVGKEIEEAILKLLLSKDEINIIFGAAPSQSDMIDYLLDSKKIPWEKINAFHMDEYIGLDNTAPQLFANFLDRHIFSKRNFKNIYYINGNTNNQAEECARYTKLLEENKADISLIGIGENGHIAFNDPDVADFNDPEIVKVVMLDEKCRMQQVNDGCFKAIDDVPKDALTLTIPALMKAEYVFCTVPAPQKSWAVTQTVLGEIDEICPASILRTKKNAKLFLDKDSGAGIL